jgi:hypothetical protein
LVTVGAAVDDAIRDFKDRMKKPRENPVSDGRQLRRVENELREDHVTAKGILDRMANARLKLQEQIQRLYAVLDLPPALEELGGIDRRFLHILIQCRETKVAIREKAVGTLFEMERMEQATGGKNAPLGMIGDFTNSIADPAFRHQAPPTNA